MSSGYCNLDDELGDYFFSAKTTIFRNVQSVKTMEETGHLPTLQEIKQEIHSYDSQENCLVMKLSDEPHLHGFHQTAFETSAASDSACWDPVPVHL
ncbi:Ras association domain-containing protein 5 [Sciurus carolinensis]|uniref:Ras association domain-containing protein 5 n=1 Tax=Sciurus carolinensis TaxID=30640 RepID=A0AA41MS54_SCICA|nr:Ras association domain-containing protein 5 [Sciurus carolinensis]